MNKHLNRHRNEGKEAEMLETGKDIPGRRVELALVGVAGKLLEEALI